MENNSATIDRAVIIAAEGRTSFADGKSSCMLPLVDRPFLQHLVECLVDAGVEDLDMILANHAEDIESHFEDGRRWGVRIRYHLARTVENRAEGNIDQDDDISQSLT